MNSQCTGTNDGDERERRLASLEKAIRALVWILGTLCAAMLVAFAWVLLQGHILDADMDLVNAARGGG